MKITFISLSDNLGGAAIVTTRLARALHDMGHQVTMLVGHKSLPDTWIRQVTPAWRLKWAFLSERLGIFVNNGFDRRKLFKVSTASAGMPLWRDPAVRDADVVVAGWFNQGMLSLRGLGRIIAAGKPVIWMMHDMWALTGICHHAGECLRYESGCGHCPLLGRGAGRSDLSRRVFSRKEALYGEAPKLRFVAVSSWLADKARSSALLRGRNIEVLPNGLDLRNYGLRAPVSRLRLDLPARGRLVLMGAARLDDSVKGLDLAIEALNRVASSPYGRDVTAVFFGALRNPRLLETLRMPYVWLGPVYDADTLASLYIHADVVFSSSRYETFGATLCEGMACGCVPVSFSRGGQSDIITHLDTGWLATPDDPASLAEGILWALNADIPAEKLMARARTFDISRIATRFLTLLSPPPNIPL